MKSKGRFGSPASPKKGRIEENTRIFKTPNNSGFAEPYTSAHLFTPVYNANCRASSPVEPMEANTLFPTSFTRGEVSVWGPSHSKNLALARPTAALEGPCFGFLRQ